MIKVYPDGGLGLANSAGAIGNALLLTYAFRRKLPLFKFSELRGPVFRMIVAALVAAGAMYLSRWGWDRWIGHAKLLAKAGAVFVPAGVGGLAYLGAAWGAGLQQPRDIVEAAKAWFGGEAEDDDGGGSGES